jgi:hypothetical protein
VGRTVRLGGAKGATYQLTTPAGAAVTVNETGKTYVTADENGMLPQFHTTDVPTVVVQVSPGLSITVHSLEAVAGSASYAAAAASSATDAANSASDAAASAASAGNKVPKDTLVFNVKDHGAVGDGTTDDTTAIQSAITAAPAGSVVYLPPGTYKTSATLTVTKALRIVGANRYTTMLTTYACDAITISAGVHHAHVESLGLNTSVVYTTTANTLTGIKVAGTDASRCAYHLYRDLWVQGFKTAIQTASLWSSRFEDVHTAYGLLGIDAYGLGQNNHVTNCNLVVGDGAGTRLAGSKCVGLNGQVSVSDTTAEQGEGWIISHSVLSGADYGVDGQGYGNYIVSNNIIDYVHLSAVRTINNGTAYGGNVNISGNYMAMAGDSAATGGMIDVANNTGAQRGVRIMHNDLLTYSGATAPYGIRVIAATPASAVIIGNTFAGFTTNDIKLQSSGNTVVGNRCLSAITNNIYTDAGQFNLVADNQGTVFLDSSAGFPNSYVVESGQKVLRGTAAPTVLSWAKGDRVINSAPAVGSPKAWVCTVAGSPGTWVSEGNL